MCRVVAYYRVSRERQGRSGLGLDAQRTAVAELCQARGWQLCADFTEVESGKRNDRPALTKAIHSARVTGAVLVIAKLDRLARNVQFLLALVDGGTDVAFGDLPKIEGAMGRFVLTQMAAVAELEAGLASERTKAALAAAKARGTQLGNPNGAAALRRAAKGNLAALEAVKAGAAKRAADYAPVIADIQANGATSLPALARELNERGIVTPRGGRWHASSVRNLLARLEV